MWRKKMALNTMFDLVKRLNLYAQRTSRYLLIVVGYMVRLRNSNRGGGLHGREEG